LGLALFGVTGCETTVEREPTVTTTTRTTEVTEMRRPVNATATETRVVREY
jgi:hypothetical protein